MCTGWEIFGSKQTPQLVVYYVYSLGTSILVRFALRPKFRPSTVSPSLCSVTPSFHLRQVLPCKVMANMNEDDPVFRALIDKSSLAELRPCAEKCPDLLPRIRAQFCRNKCDCQGCMHLHPISYEGDDDDPTCRAPLFWGNGPWPSKCKRCYAELCNTCALFCGDCGYAICRECDECDKCETYSCPLCIFKRQCTDCHSTFCFKVDCHEELQQCNFCPRMTCAACRAYDGSWRCQGRDGQCTSVCCKQCFEEDFHKWNKWENCKLCQVRFCHECHNEHANEGGCVSKDDSD